MPARSATAAVRSCFSRKAAAHVWSCSAFRFIAGADAIAQAEEKLAERRQQIDAHRELSTSLALDEVTALSR